jgi:hypothetical protein
LFPQRDVVGADEGLANEALLERFMGGTCCS